MFYEIRRYQTQPGRREEFVQYMEAVVLLPFQASTGMAITASFVVEGDADGYVWIRRFEDEAERAALYAATYESERWTRDIAPRVGTLLRPERTVVTRVVPTPASALR